MKTVALIAVFVFGVIGSYLGVGAALARPSPELAKLSAHSLLAREVDVCEVAGATTHVLRGTVVDWKYTGKRYFESAGADMDYTEVVLDVAETLKGELKGLVTVAVVGPFNLESGGFLNGVLKRDGEAYFAIKDIDGASLIATRGFWPITEKRDVAVSGKVIDEELFRAQSMGRAACE